MTRRANSEERRAQIAAGLLRVMARKGYDGASINEIAEAAELTPGLLHYHFGSKLKILLYAFEKLVERHEAQFDARLAEAPQDPSAQVAAWIDLHLGLGAAADPEALACWILFGGEALRQSAVRAVYAEALEEIAGRLRAMILRGVVEGVFHCDEPDAAAAALVAAVQGYSTLAASARQLIPSGSAARSVLRMATGLLRPSRPLSAVPASAAF